MKLAVTGATGLIGANVVDAAIAAGHRPVAIVRPGSRGEPWEQRGLAVVRADLLGEQEPLVAAFAGCEAVIHTAAIFSYHADPRALHDLAVRGTGTVIAAAAAAGVRRVVVTSSSVVFGHAGGPQPRSEADGIVDSASEPPYVAAKIAQHRAALALGERLGVEIVLACPTVTIGATAAQLGPSNRLILGYLGDPSRSTYPGGCNIAAAADVGAGHVLLAERATAGGSYLLGAENLRWAELHREIGRLTGVGGPNAEISPQLARLAAAAEEWTARLTGRAPRSSRHEAGMLGRFYWYDDAAARRLGYAPRSAAQALLEAISWLVASAHVSREQRAAIRLADEVHRFRYGTVAA